MFKTYIHTWIDTLGEGLPLEFVFDCTEPAVAVDELESLGITVEQSDDTELSVDIGADEHAQLYTFLGWAIRSCYFEVIDNNGAGTYVLG